MRKRKSKSIGVMTSFFFILLLTGAVSTAAETQGGVAGNLIDKNIGHLPRYKTLFDVGVQRRRIAKRKEIEILQMIDQEEQK